MIEMRRQQLSFGDGLIAEEVSDLREDCETHRHDTADEGFRLPLNISYAPISARAACIARHTFSGVTGISRWRMP
jgi:hypothetical protein